MSDDNLEIVKLVWDEYKYRHEHCWKLIFQLTAAVVIVSVVPYVNEKVALVLGNWIIGLPLLGIALLIFSILRVNKELVLWKTIRDRHISLQNRLKIIENKEGRSSSFQIHVKFYLITLLAISVGNCILIIIVWLPALEMLRTKIMGQ